jgi:carbonic anhydrase/acetyltransferase-like protein (isoleucine patch superfamily)
MPILDYKDLKPLISDNAYVAPNATIIGDVNIKDHAVIWPGCVIRGDYSTVTIGEYTTIFDGVVLHARTKNSPINIGNYNIIETGTCIYGLFTEDYVIISKNTVVFEATTMGEGVLILPDSTVPAGVNIPARTVMQGDPVITVRELSREDVERQKERADYYSELFEKIKATLPNIQPYVLSQADVFKFILEKKQE